MFEMKLRFNVAATFVVATLSACTLAAPQDLFVSSEGTNSVKRYDGATGAYIGDFVTANSGGLVAPQGITFGSDGHLYVSGGGSGAVHKYNGQTGASMGAFTTGYTFGFTADLEFRGNRLYVSDFANNGGVIEFDATTGAYIRKFAHVAAGSDGFVWDATGNMYVSDWSGSIRKFDSSGSFLSIFASGGGLNSSLDLRWGAGGDLYVNNFFSGSVKRFDGVTGAYEGDFVSGLARTQGQLIAPDGTLLVGDYGTHRINKYNANTGAFVSSFVLPSSGGLLRPNNFTLNPVPEPMTAVSLALGALFLRRKRRN